MKNDVKKCLFLIFLLRVAAFAAALLMLVLLMKNVDSLGHKLMRYKLYESLNHYYGISILPDVDASDETMQKLDDALVNFYRETCGKNSRLLSVETAISLYDEGLLAEEDLETGDFTITVNAQYLKEHPVFDSDGEQVQVSGDEDRELLLIPLKYKNREAELITFFEENDTFLKYYKDDVQNLGVEEAQAQKHEKMPIDIIYIMDGQKHDIYNMSQVGKLKGIVNDPLIRVVTEETVSDAQIPAYVTNKDYLIKVENDSEMLSLNQAVVKTGLEKFVMNIEPANKYFLRDLRYNFTAIVVQLLIMAVSLTGVSVAEKRFLKNQGFKVIKTLILSWILSFGLYIILNNGLKKEFVLGFLILIIFDYLSIKTYTE